MLYTFSADPLAKNILMSKSNFLNVLFGNIYFILFLKNVRQTFLIICFEHFGNSVICGSIHLEYNSCITLIIF